MFRRAWKTARKAAGPDGWSGALFALLPLAFFEKLADIWNTVRDGAPIPEAWKDVRISLNPMPDGSLRPLGIAQNAWRIGACDLAAQLAPWADQVLDEALVGGLQGRCADDLHHQLYGGFANALGFDDDNPPRTKRRSSCVR